MRTRQNPAAVSMLRSRCRIWQTTKAYDAVVLGGATLTPWLAARRDRRRSRAFVRAYLVSILEIAKSRGHVERANSVLAAWKVGQIDVDITTFGSESDAIGDPVANGEMLKQAGFLAMDDAADLARFIGSLRAVRIDMDKISTPEFKASAVAAKISALEWTVSEWDRAKGVAENLIKRLEH
jgi:hypothetical protein